MDGIPELDSASNVCSVDKIKSGDFFGLPNWWDYLPNGKEDGVGNCLPHISKLTDLWYVALALLDILLTVAGILAFFYIIYAGIQFVLSQGEPDKAKAARQRIINVAIGLVIVMTATAIVRFVGRSLG